MIKGKKKKDKKKENPLLQSPQKSKLLKSVRWQNLRLGQKYGLAFAITLVSFCISAVVIFTQLSAVNNKMIEVEKSGDNSVAITEMATVFQQLGSEISMYIENSNIKHMNSFQKLTEDFTVLEAQIRPSLLKPEHKQVFNKVVDSERELIQLFAEKVIPAVKAQQKLSSTEASKAADELIQNTVSMLTELRSELKTASKAAVDSASTNLKSTIIVLIGSIIVSAAVGIISIVIIGRIVKKKFDRLITISHSIASGNLNVTAFEQESDDEIGVLSKSINKMRESLQMMIQEISAVSSHVTDKSTELTGTSTEVKAASQQVASTMQELSTGAEEQAHSSTVLARMMEDYVVKINTANGTGIRVRQSSDEVLALTQKGNMAMNESTIQMNKINNVMELSVSKVKGLDEQTKQISTLVQVIREIADQTNLLALNAAIEAARAGEHGKGFAVVADEVRKLAEGVSHSVKDIRNIVLSIQKESNDVAESLLLGYKQVEEGTKQIENTGQTFKDINTAVTNMSENIEDITSSLVEIAENTVTMNNAVENIAAVSEQSATGVEQTSASVQETNSSMELIADSAESLSDLAAQLNKMIGKFTLK